MYGPGDSPAIATSRLRALICWREGCSEARVRHLRRGICWLAGDSGVVRSSEDEATPQTAGGRMD